ncbi:hypothetical protein PFISCL1PPCAC_16484, partial [Pristionchus fissidentatus]
FDMELLAPEIIQLIIKQLGLKDRCTLREFSSLDEAISQSHLDLSHSKSSVIHLQARHGNFSMQFSASPDGGRLAAPLGSETLMLRLRKRLFKRATVKQLKLSHIDFNIIPMSFVDDLLDGCVYDRLSITVTAEQYNPSVYPFLKKQGKELELTMGGVFMEKEALLALDPMRKLVIRLMMGSSAEPRWEDEAEMMVALVKKRHSMLDVILAEFRSPEAIFDIFTFVASFDQSQCVIFNVSFRVLNQFMQHIGYQRDSYDQQFDDRYMNEREQQPIGIVHDELLTGRWTGEFELSFLGGTLEVRAHKSFSCTWINFWTIVITNKEFDRGELGKEYSSIRERELEGDGLELNDE